MTIIAASNPNLFALPLTEVEMIFDANRGEDRVDVINTYKEKFSANPVVAWNITSEGATPITPHFNDADNVILDKSSGVWSHDDAEGNTIGDLMEYLGCYMLDIG